LTGERRRGYGDRVSMGCVPRRVVRVLRGIVLDGISECASLDVVARKTYILSGVVTICVQVALNIVMVVLMCTICNRGGYLSVLPRRLHGFCRHICFHLNGRTPSPDLSWPQRCRTIDNVIKGNVCVEKNCWLSRNQVWNSGHQVVSVLLSSSNERQLTRVFRLSIQLPRQ
jgi:hypothetical protein